MTSLALACKLGTAAAISQLPTRVKRILRKYGATLLMPSPAVPILGPEQVVGGSFDSADGWTTGSGWSISGGVCNVNCSAYAFLERSFAAGTKTYLFEFEITSYTSGLLQLILTGGTGVTGLQFSSAGKKQQVVVGANNTAIRLQSGPAGFVGVIDNVSVREILGYQNTYSSFVAGNYRESTGQTLAAVDQQVGLVVDAAQSPGPELAAPLSAWTLSIDPSLALVGEEAVFTAAPTGQLITCPVSISEKTLAVEFEISEYVAGTLQVRTIGGTTYTSSVTHSGNGRKREVIKALAGNSTLGIRVASAFTGRVKLISVRELPGIHASQATSGYQPVLRYAPIIGADLLADWDFLSADAWQANGAASLSVGAGVGTATFSAGSNYPTVLQYCTTEVGKTYEVEIRAKKTTTDTVRFLVGATSVNITDSYNTYRLSYQAVAASTLCRVQVAASSALAGSFEIDYFRVREIIGYDSRTQSWQFDGTDDRLSLSAMPFEMTDDFFAVFGYRAAVAADVNLLTLRNTGLTNPVIALGILPNGAPRFWARNDVGTFVQTQGVPRVGVDTVLSGRKYLATMECRVEGTLAQSAVRPANALTVNNATICASVSTGAGGFFNGNLHGAILGKGAITEAELLTLEKFIAKLQGRSL